MEEKRNVLDTLIHGTILTDRRLTDKAFGFRVVSLARHADNQCKGGHMAIITRDYALRLIRQGKARYAHGTEEGSCAYAAERLGYYGGGRYAIIDRLDLQRTDHYKLREEQ